MLTHFCPHLNRILLALMAVHERGKGLPRTTKPDSGGDTMATSSITATKAILSLILRQQAPRNFFTLTNIDEERKKQRGRRRRRAARRPRRHCRTALTGPAPAPSPGDRAFSQRPKKEGERERRLTGMIVEEVVLVEAVGGHFVEGPRGDLRGKASDGLMKSDVAGGGVPAPEAPVLEPPLAATKKDGEGRTLESPSCPATNNNQSEKLFITACIQADLC